MECLFGAGEQITLVLLERLPNLRRILATDVQAAYDGAPLARVWMK